MIQIYVAFVHNANKNHLFKFAQNQENQELIKQIRIIIKQLKGDGRNSIKINNQLIHIQKEYPLSIGLITNELNSDQILQVFETLPIIRSEFIISPQKAEKLMENILNQQKLQLTQIQKVIKNLDEVREIIVADLDKLIERGEKLEVLLSQANNLQQFTVDFKNPKAPRVEPPPKIVKTRMIDNSTSQQELVYFYSQSIGQDY
ncbi:hypothetical protein pb186bvf_019677 [Paramecium bursaria]